MELKPGAKLGPYEIVSAIGRGGMGEVWKAHDTRLDRSVAIKICETKFSSRFLREARAIASLNHPNICTLHDIGPDYLVMEYIEGAPPRGPIDPPAAVRLALGIAAALEAAHDKGITHRDLKPANVLVTQSGVKLLDFGLASVKDSAGRGISDATTRTDIGATVAGTVLGTASYMSPEQAQGKPVDARSDIFSFGLVLYELLSGRRAFTGDSAVEIMAAIIHEEPAPVVAPAKLAEIVIRCLRKVPASRFQTMSDVRAALEQATAVNADDSPSIAVLPFANWSNDPDTDYLCDGITENIINTLAQIGQLRVAPRSTVFRYKSRDADPLAVGNELRVRMVLTGRVSQRGTTLVVGAELLDVAAGAQVWGERYNRKLSDIFELEEEIARRISASLRMKLTGEQESRLAKRFTENTEAYQLYLRGRHHWIRRTPDHLKKGVEYFQQAIAKDPGYALAYSGLADCYSVLALFSVVSSREGFARAKAASAAAIALDPDLAEGHTSLAFIRVYFDCDWAAAEDGFRRALEINPSYWVASYWYSFYMMSQRREQEAEQQIRRTLELEPLSPAALHAAALVSVTAHRYSEAVERCLRGLEYDPSYFHLRLWLGLAYQCQGKYAEAIDEFEKARELSEGASVALGALGNAHGVAGNRSEASMVLKQLLEGSEREHINYYQIALVYSGLGDTKNSLLWLEKACEARDAFLSLIVKVDPRMDVLHGEVRFQKVLQRLRLT